MGGHIFFGKWNRENEIITFQAVCGSKLPSYWWSFILFLRDVSADAVNL